MMSAYQIEQYHTKYPQTFNISKKGKHSQIKRSSSPENTVFVDALPMSVNVAHKRYVPHQKDALSNHLIMAFMCTTVLLMLPIFCEGGRIKWSLPQCREPLDPNQTILPGIDADKCYPITERLSCEYAKDNRFTTYWNPYYRDGYRISIFEHGDHGTKEITELEYEEDFAQKFVKLSTRPCTLSNWLGNYVLMSNNIKVENAIQQSTDCRDPLRFFSLWSRKERTQTSFLELKDRVNRLLPSVGSVQSYRIPRTDMSLVVSRETQWKCLISLAFDGHQQADLEGYYDTRDTFQIIRNINDLDKLKRTIEGIPGSFSFRIVDLIEAYQGAWLWSSMDEMADSPTLSL